MKFFTAPLAAFCLLIGTTTTHADEGDIYTALSAIANSENGAEIADGIMKVGNRLNGMTVNETIAFRTAMHLLVSSNKITEDSTEWDMLQVLWRESEQHLVHTCRAEPTEDNVTRVNTTLPPPLRCKVR